MVTRVVHGRETLLYRTRRRMGVADIRMILTMNAESSKPHDSLRKLHSGDGRIAHAPHVTEMVVNRTNGGRRL